MEKNKIIILGHARHGKDTAAAIFESKGYRVRSSSRQALDTVIWPVMRGRYKTKKECFEDRVNHRAEWHRLISEYTSRNRARLARKIFEKNDIYVGMRCIDEFLAAKEEGLFRYAVWIDASFRCPPEPSTSMTIPLEVADIVITNNRSLEEFTARVEDAIRLINFPS